jgi:two-component sensor histidine kinase
MNRSYSKIRHIQETNERLEKRMLNEDNDNMFLKRRLSTIEELIDKNIEKVNDEGGYGFSDEFEFASNIIRWVVDELTNYDYDTYDYDELVDLIKDNFGEYILSQYVEEDFDFDDDEDFDDDDN